MGVRVVERQYIDRFTNEPTDWLLGNVGDWQKGIFTVEASVDFLASAQNPIQIDDLNNTFIIANGGNWGEFGFDNGMTITVEYKLETDTNGDGNFNLSETISETYEIQNIFGNKMVVDKDINNSDFNQIPLNFGRKRTTDLIFFVDAEPQGVKMGYTHLTNANRDSQNLTSFIDSTNTEFIAPNLSEADGGVWVDMEPTGKQSGMSVKSARVRKLTSSGDDVFVNANIPQYNNSLTSITLGAGGNAKFQNSASVITRITNPPVPYIQDVARAYGAPVFDQDSNDDPQLGNGSTLGRIIKNVPSAVEHDLKISLVLRVTSQNLGSNTSNVLRLVLYRYTNNDAMNYADTTVLKEWTPVNTRIGVPLEYTGITELSLQPSESYVLALEYRQGAYTAFQTEFITYSIDQGIVEFSQPNKKLTTGSKKRYQFELVYMISSFFDTIQDIQNLTAPSYLVNDGSLTDNFNFIFLPEWNNPNISISNDLKETVRQGNTGWFNENFNELKNNFRVNSVDYFDTEGNRVEAIDYTQKTRVKIEVLGVSNLNDETECGIGFAWIPIDEEDYKNKETAFYQNIFVQSGNIEEGFNLGINYDGPFIGAGVGAASMNLENVMFRSDNDKLIFEGTFAPNPNFTTLFGAKDPDDRTYILYLSTANSALQRNYSDRVTLLADTKQLIKTIRPAGPFPTIENLFIEHPESETVTGTDRLRAITQDDILARMPFRIARNTEEPISSFTFGVEIFNAALNKSFVLEQNQLDVSQSQRDNEGVQQFDVDETRGFLLPQGNNKNWMRILRTPEGDTENFQSFIAYYAFRIRWEDWQENLAAPADFFDANNLNNGLNNDWFDYLETEGWTINFFSLITATREGEQVVYKNTWNFDFKDYDQNSRLQTTHKYFRHSTDTDITVGNDPITGKPLGVILNNEQTRIEVSFRILDDGVFDLASYYSIITIEIDNGEGQDEVRELTTAWDKASDNPLEGITNPQRLTQELDPTNKILIAKCLVNPDMLQQAARYRITGRVGCVGEGGNFEQRLYEFRYENLYE